MMMMMMIMIMIKIMLPPVRSYLRRSRHDGKVDHKTNHDFYVLLFPWPR